MKEKLSLGARIIYTFTFRAFGRRFYPKRLTKSTFVRYIDSTISLWYIKIRIEQVSSIHSNEVNRTSFIIARLPAKIAGIRADVRF